MTECNQDRFEFATHFTRDVVADFSGGTLTSDAGGLLLREADQRLNLLSRFSTCFLDGRDSSRVEHTVAEMVTQRVYGLAMGYEDLNDHDQLRNDPLMQLLAGKRDPGSEALAGKSTLNRMELGDGLPHRYKKITFWRDAIDELLVNVFLEAYSAAPERIVLDIDTTDVAIHGEQEERFYHGFYDHYCYLPFYVFAGEHVLCARLRPSNIDPCAGSRKEIARIVRQIRQAWPEVKITLRGDSGFCREELLAWCEANQVDYVLGLARNKLLERLVGGALEEAKQKFEQTQKAARVFVEFEHETVSGTWSRKRRVVAKAEHIDGKSNPRFVVTSLPQPQWPAQALYEQVYCADHGHSLHHCLSEDKHRHATHLRVRRHGEPHQRAVLAVCGSRERRHDESQSVAPVPVDDQLCAALRSTQVGIARHRTGTRASRFDPSAFAQDRCANSGHGAEGLGTIQQQLPASSTVCTSADATALLNAGGLR